MNTILLNNHLSSVVGSILLALTFLSFGLDDTETNQSTLQFEEVNFTIESATKNDKNLEYKFLSEGLELKLDIYLETELCNLTVMDITVQTEFNYFCDTDLESAIEEIKILKSTGGNDFVVLLPTFTEEFLTFQLITFDTQSNTFKNGVFEIDTHNYSNVRNFYLNNNITLTQNKDHFEISLGDFQSAGIFNSIQK